jgi:lipopolysaccharide export system permease protein
MVMSFAIILFILVLQFLSMYINEIAGKGISLSIIGRLFMYASGKLSLLALPVAILAAALMTYGSLGEHNELAALKSSGIGLWKIGRPMFVFSLFLTALSFWFSFQVVPMANLKFFSLLYDVGKKKAELTLKPGQFYRDIDGYVIRISDKSIERRTLYDIMIYNHTENRGAVDVIAADSARTRINEKDPSSLQMVLYDGVRHEDYKPDPGKVKGYNYGRTYFDSLLYKFKLKGFELDRTDEGLFARHQVTLSQWKLGEALDSLFHRRSGNLSKFRNYLRPYTRLDSNFLPGYVPRPTIRDTLAEKAKAKPQTSQKKDSTTQKLPGLIKKKVPQKVVKATQEKPATQVETAKPTGNSPPKHNGFPDTLPEMKWPEKQDSSLSSLDLFPDANRVEAINKALSASRAVKNYVEFITRKRREETKRINRYIYEYQFRISSPLNVIFFMLIGIALGAIIRKGGLGVPALLSTLLLVLAYVINAQGKKFAKEAILDPTLSAWLPAIVFGPVAIFLIYKAANESRILDEAVWAKIGSFQFFRRKFKSANPKMLDNMDEKKLPEEGD